MSLVTVYVIEWYDCADQPLGGAECSFRPGEGRVRHATIGPPGPVRPPGYPHSARTVERLEVAAPAGWELDDPDRPCWLVNRRAGRPGRLDAGGVYLCAVRGSAGFAVAAPLAAAG